MMKHLFVIVLFFMAGVLYAQSDGDYRSIASGTWNSGTVWERYNSFSGTWIPTVLAPTNADGDVIIRSPHVITVNTIVTGIDEVNIQSGGTLIISNQFILVDGLGADMVCSGTLQHTAGILSGQGEITVFGKMIWSGGTLAVLSVDIFGDTLTVNTFNVKNLNTELVIHSDAVMNWNGGVINFNSGILTNYGVINNSFDGAFNNVTGESYFVNYGTFSKTAGTAATTDNLPYTGNAADAHFNIYAGAYSHTKGYFQNEGKLHIENGSTFTNSDTIFFGTDADPFTGSGTISFSGLSVNYVSLPLTLAPGIAFNFAGGKLLDSINGSLTLQKTMNWTAGTVDCDITFINNCQVTLSGTAVKILSARLDIAPGSIVNWDNGTISFNNGYIYNEGMVNNSFNASLFGSSGTNTLDNIGTFNKTGGTGSTSSNGLSIINSGTFKISSGSFNSTNGSFENDGSLQVSQGCTFINSSQMDFTNRTLLTGTGTLSLSAGSHNFQSTVAAPAGFKVTLAGGTLDGAGKLFINGTMTWTAGTIECPVTIGIDDTITVNTSAVKNLNDTLLLNEGAVMNWSAGNINFNTALLDNYGTINNSFDGTMNNTSGTNSFYNEITGVFNKTAGAATTTIHVTETVNNGSFNISSGYFNNGTNTFNNFGNININAGAFFYNSATINFYGLTILSGNGTLTLYTGTHNFAGIGVQLPAGLTVNLAGGVFNNPGSAEEFGIMNWTGGTMKCLLNIKNGAVLNVSGTALKYLEWSLYIDKGAVMNWSNGNITFNNGALFNYGTINTSFDGSLTNGTATNIFYNGVDAVFKKTGGAGGSTSCSVPAENEGIIAGTGTISFTAIQNTGTIAPGLSPGILGVNSNNDLLVASSKLDIELKNGTGVGTGHDLLQHNSSLKLNGTLNVTETGVVPDGTYLIITLSAGTISGNFSTANLPAGYVLLTSTSSVSLVKNITTGNYYRSKATGEWTNIATWEVSADGVNWANTTVAPATATNIITIRDTHIVTVNANINTGLVQVEKGGTLIINTGSLTIHKQ